MTRAPQKRKTETRAKMLAIGANLLVEKGFSGFRVEDVVTAVGVAKGTFFSHFTDKDGMLSVLIGAQVSKILTETESQNPPTDIHSLCTSCVSFMQFMIQDRIVFDLFLRYSGTTSAHVEPEIAESFERQIRIMAEWIVLLQTQNEVRADVDAGLLAEGLQAFLIQIVALSFCTDMNAQAPLDHQLARYALPWLSPRSKPLISA